MSMTYNEKSYCIQFGLGSNYLDVDSDPSRCTITKTQLSAVQQFYDSSAQSSFENNVKYSHRF